MFQRNQLLALLFALVGLVSLPACIETSPDDDDTTGDDDDATGDDDDATGDDDDSTGDDDDSTGDDDDSTGDDDDSTGDDNDGDGSPAGEDCDDDDPNNFPGNPEVCDGQDNDCSGNPDSDEVDEDSDGELLCDGDCNDLNDEVSTTADEICDGLDNNCDSTLPADESDADTDGQMTCEGDCDDGDSANYLGGMEICDGQDNDCDGNPGLGEVDVDGDGSLVCDGDCDDTVATGATVFPGATESCNGIDDDCSGAPNVDEVDGDSDSFMICAGDCDDGDAGVNPAASELCDGIDTDCSGAPGPDEVDGDGDNYMVCENDCDDGNPARNPGENEVCDAVDNDCDGSTDEGVPNDGNGCIDPGMPTFPANVSDISFTVVTANTLNAGTDDSNDIQICVTATDCFDLNNDQFDDLELGSTNYFTFENVGIDRTSLDRFQILASNADAWTPACIEMTLDGEQTYCFDNYNETFGSSWTTNWNDPNGDGWDNLTCDSCLANKLTHGPMIGATESDSAKIWVRTHATKQTELKIKTGVSLPWSTINPVSTAYPGGDSDMTHVFDISGLQSDTNYYYQVSVDGTVEATSSFRTNPTGPTSMTFAFGSCAKNEDQSLFADIDAESPDVFLFMGDNHYANSGELSALRQFYKWSLERPERAALADHTTTLAIWDDHDFTGNNTDGTSPGKDNALQAFTEYWANDDYGTPTVDGIFSTWSYGDLDFFLLDDRYHRAPPGDASGSVLGTDQLDWLKTELLASTATFKFLMSGSQWTTEGSEDSWANWPEVQTDFMDWIAANNVEGVVMLSGDVHRSELRMLPGGDGGYSIPELTSSPLANNTTNCTPSNELDNGLSTEACYSTESFLLVDVDTTSSPATLTVEVHDGSGTPLDSWTIYQSSLTNPNFVPVDTVEQPDFNGDGYADMMVGIPYDDIGSAFNAGGVIEFHGSSEFLRSLNSDFIEQDDQSIPGASEAYDSFGFALASGDFDGDGFSDVAIGSHQESINGESSTGMVTIIYGSADGLDLTTSHNFHQDTAGVPGIAEVGDNFGATLASGDFNGDGYDDLAIGVPGEDLGSDNEAGDVAFIYGSASGLDASNNSSGVDSHRIDQEDMAGLNYSNEDDDNCGESLAAGDFDGDGYDDIAWGCPGEDLDSNSVNSAGVVMVAYGQSSGVQVTGGSAYNQNTSGIGGNLESLDQFGYSLAAGDIDGDGYDELAVGIPYENTGDASGGNTATDGGRVSLIYGSNGGLTAAGADIYHASDINTVSSDQAYARFGFSLTIGDFNGDGYGDLAAGATGWNSNAGAVGVLPGSASGINETLSHFLSAGNAPWPLSSDGQLGYAITSMDLDADGRDELVASARNQNIGADDNTGAVLVMPGTLFGASITISQYWHQDLDEVPGANEDNDQFGTSLLR